MGDRGAEDRRFSEAVKNGEDRAYEEQCPHGYVHGDGDARLMPEILPSWDRAATRDLYANKFFLSRDSYITFADAEGICHFVLEGPDRTLVRKKLWAIAPHRCIDCKTPLTEDTAEMDHIQGGNSGRCDCLRHGRKRGNLAFRCNTCHRKKHNRDVQLGTIPAREVTGTGEPKYVNSAADRRPRSHSADDDPA